MMTVVEDLCLLPSAVCMGCTFWSVGGLLFDIAGFGVLVFDLVRTQELVLQKNDALEEELRGLRELQKRVDTAMSSGRTGILDPARFGDAAFVYSSRQAAERGEVIGLGSRETSRVLIRALESNVAARKQLTVSASATIRNTEVAVLLIVVGFLGQLLGALPGELCN
ncbi:hypothetical protein [Roseibium litorale]|uniref:Uncharacterized protein n=1 Tax=Roseibium litorale TaxID=2803841 RepID=A0ABR9CJ69_9HYPH|nr:hypothetical protein [Roseibium litorale]MBD8890885.1 hypothetical protein [Roseibium litorale]